MGPDLWVFGYGSLMWRPGFDPDEQVGAVLRGYHRAMCLLSMRYRGQPEAPGLVAGLRPGGCCRGMALRVAAERAEAVRAYLFEREMSGDAYRAVTLPVRLDDGRRVEALCFVINRLHQNYSADLPLDRAAEIIRQGVGERGASREYLANTVADLCRLGQRNGTLHRLLRRVEEIEKNQLEAARKGDTRLPSA